MSQMTTGQRIATQRKLANYSQEFISEQLGVSRQAVSKWESDAGLPDIDNLIALSKLFGVSVGWLLGTEQDPSFDPSTGLSDAQLKMVEQLFHHHFKGLRNRIFAIFMACILVVSIMGFFLYGQLTRLSKGNDTAQVQIATLEADNHALLQQLENVTSILNQQLAEDRLLLNCITKAYLNDDMQTVTVSFYLLPKLFQENAQAYLTIINTSSDSFPAIETFPCEPLGKWYFCRAELPVADGYSYSFLLAAEGSFQEQSLNAYLSPYQNLHNATHYHTDPEVEQRAFWQVRDSEYTFTQPICSPVIDFANGYVGYEAVDVTLLRNNEPIWAESLRDAFREHAGAYMRSVEPLIPDIRVNLPQLTPGDILTLEISAKNYNGQVLSNVLEKLEVMQ